MAFNRVTDFTTDHAAIDRMLERFKKHSERLEFDINQYWVHHAGDPLSPALQAGIDDVFLGPWSSDGGTDRTRRDGTIRPATPMLLGTGEAGKLPSRPGLELTTLATCRMRHHEPI
jgi:hypothetical protein